MSESINPTLEAVLFADMLNSSRRDNTIANQAVINHQGSSNLTVLTFLREVTELSIPESQAIQGATAAQAPRDAMGVNLAHKTPTA